MTRKFISIAVMIFFAVLLTSCGNGSEPDTVDLLPIQENGGNVNGSNDVAANNPLTAAGNVRWE